MSKRVLMGAVAAASMMSLGVQAQDLTMATFGGGVDKTSQSGFAQPFTAASGINVKIVPAPSPKAANLLKDGLIEAFAGSDLPPTAETYPKWKGTLAPTRGRKA